MSQDFQKTDRTRVNRMPQRANYDKAAVYELIDESLFGTVAFNDGSGVQAIPTAIWREQEHLYIHGSKNSRLLQVLAKGQEACISITRIDGLVLARSAPQHSLNYHSVCIYGIFENVDSANKSQHMKYFLEHWAPGRWQYVRSPNEKELAGLMVMRIPIVEAVLKSRQGPPNDHEADKEQPVWAGVMPLRMHWQSPKQVDEQNEVNLPGQTLRKLV